ncbi:MAG: lysophospholipid acyltransferase family protein [Dysgonamonadaceae bacterium]|jgi:putative hemolysin|nr:lysophospholipid acyltransferase family protein [Dysgonamonadaceae bacterium]
MKEKLIDKQLLERISPVFANSLLRKCVVKIGGLDKVNRVYDSAKHLSGTDIEDAMIDGLGIMRRVHNIEVLRQFDGQPFITVSNHPYGHIDGILLIGEVAKVRPDYKVMVNWMLGQIDIMQDHFIGVNPYSSDQVNRSSVGGVKESLRHLKENHPLGFFPAGSVSKNAGFNKVKDRRWQAGVIKLIQKAQVPIIPAFISGKNSWFFNFLDHFHWTIRNIRLCHELDTKKGQTIHLVFGEPILPEKQKEFADTGAFGEFLKEQTYALANTL